MDSYRVKIAAFLRRQRGEPCSSVSAEIATNLRISRCKRKLSVPVGCPSFETKWREIENYLPAAAESPA